MRTRVRCVVCVVVLSASFAVGGPRGDAAIRQWSITPTASLASSDSALLAVSCTTSKFCVAVGRQTAGGSPSALIELWDGANWSVMTSPNASFSMLTGVSCTSSTNCVAVGFFTDSRTLIESWDGESWSIRSSPNAVAAGSQLEAVSCATATACVAVGYSFSVNHENPMPLEASWDGTSWTLAKPPTAAVGGDLLGVSCSRPTRCTAVGGRSAGGVLIEQSAGRRWTVTPSSGGPYDVLKAVSCRNPSTCVAVGQRDQAYRGTLVDTWNGSTWSSQGGADPGTEDDALLGADCLGAARCVAVGGWADQTPRGDIYRTLINSSHATSWSVAKSPHDVGASYSTLFGVSCTADRTCVAVGYATSKTNTEALALTGSAGPPV